MDLIAIVISAVSGGLTGHFLSQGEWALAALAATTLLSHLWHITAGGAK
jgi:hypothetical protein